MMMALCSSTGSRAAGWRAFGLSSDSPLLVACLWPHDVCHPLALLAPCVPILSSALPVPTVLTHACSPIRSSPIDPPTGPTPPHLLPHRLGVQPEEILDAVAWARQHDQEAKQIAEQGQAFAFK